MDNYLNDLKGLKVLVTGASSGIGHMTAHTLAGKGCQLFVTARREERLKALKSQNTENIQFLAGDLNNPSFFNELETNGYFDVDILINNAGLALGKEHFHLANNQDIETVINTNITSSFKVVRRCLEYMKKKQFGDIVNITSIASHESYEGGAVYAASKHALLSLGKALRQETYGENIRVINISPGMVETEFSEARFRGDKEKAKQVYEGFKPLTAYDIAYQIIHALSCPRHINLDEILVLATDQAGATKVKRK